MEPLIIEQRRDESRCGPSSFNGSEETQIKVNHSRATYWRDLRESGVSGKKLEAQEAVQNLIFHFGERPSVSMYAALIAAEADPQHGSAADVERLLGELDAEGLHRELEIYDAALKVHTLLVDMAMMSDSFTGTLYPPRSCSERDPARRDEEAMDGARRESLALHRRRPFA